MIPLSTSPVPALESVLSPVRFMYALAVGDDGAVALEDDHLAEGFGGFGGDLDSAVVVAGHFGFAEQFRQAFHLAGMRREDGVRLEFCGPSVFLRTTY